MLSDTRGVATVGTTTTTTTTRTTTPVAVVAVTNAGDFASDENLPAVDHEELVIHAGVFTNIEGDPLTSVLEI